jgi:hypothetical protein
MLDAIRILSCAALFALAAGGGAAASPWLVISDVHFDPADRATAIPGIGRDTNGALLDSMLAEAARVSPDPPVVILTGDSLAHHFPTGAAAAETMAALATRFNTTFPHAQFVLTLGNNDAACGDYAVTPNDAFLNAVAAAWAPLVNRRNASPAFAVTFARFGAYVATLPIPGLKAVVVDDTFWSTKYEDSCGGSSDAPARALADFRRLLAATAPADHVWVVMHVPIGINAASNPLNKKGKPSPYLHGASQKALLAAIRAPAAHVALVLVGHTHRFAFRLSDDDPSRARPVLVAPAVSPIYGNGPSFLALDVAQDGGVDNVVEYSFASGAWRREGDLRELGMTRLGVADIVALGGRLGGDERLRRRVLDLYEGGGLTEARFTGWQPYWCAARFVSATGYAACLANP